MNTNILTPEAAIMFSLSIFIFSCRYKSEFLFSNKIDKIVGKDILLLLNNDSLRELYSNRAIFVANKKKLTM